MAHPTHSTITSSTSHLHQFQTHPHHSHPYEGHAHPPFTSQHYHRQNQQHPNPPPLVTQNHTTSGGGGVVGRKSHSSTGKRPARPAFRRVPSSPTAASSYYNNKPQKKVLIEENAGQRDLDDMAASFPQYCTMCENQIIIPSNYVLYCSEGCRRRDSNKPLTSSSQSFSQSPPLTPTLSYPDEFAPPRDIIPQRSPTVRSNNRFSYTSNSSNSSDNEQDQDHETDQEAEIEQETFEDGSIGNGQQQQHPKRPSLRHLRQDSEAARYLRQFQSSSFVAESSSRAIRRPKHHSRSSTASLAPSLTSSPSPGTSPSTPLSSLPYSRPLPPRTNPYSSSYGARSISLVTPLAGGPQSLPYHHHHHHISHSNGSSNRLADSSLAGLKSAPSISTDVGASELPDELPPPSSSGGEPLSYEKRAMVGRNEVEQDQGSLRYLFRFNDMQAPPTR